MKLINVKLEQIEHHPNQPRTKLEGIKELADSIRARGIIVPPIVVADGNRYVCVDGHRRIAAAKLAKLSEIQVNVAEDWTEASMLQDAMAANMQRDDMSAGDTARGLQTLLDMGVDRVDVMKATGRSEAELAFASTIATAPRKAAKAAEVQASLEEGAALVEFAGDEKVVAELTENIGTARFAHTLAIARQVREYAAARDASTASLKAAGVPLLKPEQTWNGSARRITHFMTKVTPEEHANCAGHSATVAGDGAIAFWCTTPAKHDSRLASEPKSEKQREEDRAKRAARAAFKACRTVRHEYARRLIAGLEANKGHRNEALVYIAHRAVEHGIERRDYGGQTRSDEFMPLTPTPVQTLLVLAIAQQEKGIDDTIKFNAGFSMQANVEGRYYDLLQLVGYELAECEAAVIKADACRTCGGEKKTFVNRAGIREYSTCPACKGSGKRGPATVVVSEPVVGNGDLLGDLSATEASLIWRHAKESGSYEYASPGSGGEIVYKLFGQGCFWTFQVHGETYDAAVKDAGRLAIIAGMTIDYAAEECVAGWLDVGLVVAQSESAVTGTIDAGETITAESLAQLWDPDGAGRSVTTTTGGARLDLARGGGRVVLAVFGVSRLAAEPGRVTS